MPRFCLVVLTALVGILFSGPSLAYVVLEESFDSDLANFVAGTQWDGSYCQDNWRSDLNGGVISNRDDGCADCGCDFLTQSGGENPCISSDPFDNHIQTGNKFWQNYVYSVKFKSSDNDTLGVVFRYRDASNFYLFALSRSAFPQFSSGCEESFNGAALVRVRSETGPQVLKSTENFTYAENVVHQVRITAVKNNLKVEFDKDGDGEFQPGEVFFDQADEKSKAIPAGKVGLFAFQTGVTEADGTASTCSDTNCWFDDVKVDLLPANDIDCGGYPWEGACEGGSLKWCNLNGKFKTDTCGDDSCCKWVAGEGFFTCVPAGQCSDNCADACAAADKGCSSNLTHSYTCGQADDDPCMEPVFLACPAGQFCSPQTGECSQECVPDCAGKECGDDGCGGSCGACDPGTECTEGNCKGPELGKMGDPCETNLDCISYMCVESSVGPICSKACGGDASCPIAFKCEEVMIGQATILACVPTGECIPDCIGKDCGDDGCDGSCGNCPDGYSCSAGACKTAAGASCESASECAGNLCVNFQSGTLCSTPCSTAEGCPEGWECSPWISADAQHICAPPSTMTAHETCKELAECVSGCPSGSPQCKTSCFFFGNDEAKETYAPLWWCAETNCFENCEGASEDCLGDCIAKECFQEFAACWPGETSCKEAIQCVIDCEGKSSCAQECYDEALPAAKITLKALQECVGALCPVDSGGDCFLAAVSQACKDQYDACTQGCEPMCGDAVCGDDGCGGLCGECEDDFQCKQGQCTQVCATECDGKDCGDDGCGGQCGACAEGLYCAGAQCVPEGECVGDVEQKCDGHNLYWYDSCGAQGDLVQECPLGCEDGTCIGQSEDEITAQVDASPSQPDGSDSIVMSAGQKKSGGCQATPGSTAGNSGLLLLLAALACLAIRRRYA